MRSLVKRRSKRQRFTTSFCTNKRMTLCTGSVKSTNAIIKPNSARLFAPLISAFSAEFGCQLTKQTPTRKGISSNSARFYEQIEHFEHFPYPGRSHDKKTSESTFIALPLPKIALEAHALGDLKEVEIRHRSICLPLLPE